MEVQRHLPEIERRMLQTVATTGLVREMIRYHLATGGKRVRALLPVWVCENLGGDGEAALDLGAGLELLHNATLVHDDLQDGDTHRRGHPTVWHRWGMPQAINAGNALIFEAFAHIARAPAAPRILEHVAAALVQVTEGQAMEFQLQLPPGHVEHLPPTLASWEVMARGKTGALLAACMRAGAAAAGADDEVLESAAAYGSDIGLLFQVQDDYLDLVGDKGRARRATDLMEGKLSFPIVWAHEHAAPADVALLRALLDRPREQRTWEMADAALGALRQCGALAATAAWLVAARKTTEEHPVADLVPGWAAQCLAPVAHALSMCP
ncbi:isoprenyl diphosphate synthase/Farnesyl pyrophosphate synthetase [Chondromyces apiculatus DSM 436]|uniref:Isoprenyl diphosphate synthase/Farnesyl pyrophosphate synthetase n=1 Tax=Chondromyces apiculatus DSM 436 TaxID=1192034 RepID=A0A017THH4_9BACT|nr:isoprenyl diphosphate synthase/Farnesyl pyrophosphate synthetase [Chondromyces apiculatus DSM 436]